MPTPSQPPFVRRTPYRGPLQAAILDWAGTTVDYGCQAPVIVLRELFAARGVPITNDEARFSMGLLKKDQIRTICSVPRVQQEWIAKYGHAPAEKAVEALFADFIPRQLSCLADHSALIPGVAEAATAFQRRGLKIGTTTGYTRPMLDLLLERAAAQGYRPDSSVCPDDVGAGRPAPWMCYENAVRLHVYPLEACVKIGDTVSDVEEGLNAGMWTIALARTGNEIGLTERELESLAEADRHALVIKARQRLAAAGAHYVVDGLPECHAVLHQIEDRLRQGELP